MNSARQKWIDQAKGFALLISIYFIFTRWLLVDFKDWDYGGFKQSAQIDLINGIEIFARMGVIFLSALSFKFVGKKDGFWFLKKGIQFIVLPTIILMYGHEYIGLHWEFFQSLGIYFLLLYYLNKISSQKYFKWILSFIILALYVASLPWWESWSQNFVGSILFGNFTENNLFNLFSGLPMVVVSSLLADIIIKKHHVQLKPLLWATGVSASFFALLLSGYQWAFLGGKVFFYPPHILEYASGLTLALSVVCFSYLVPLKPLMVIGRYGFMNFWICWLGSFIVMDWNQMGLYQYSLVGCLAISSIFSIILIMFNYLWERNYGKK